MATPPEATGNPDGSSSRGRSRDTFVAWVAAKLAAASGAVLLALFTINIVQIVARPMMGGWVWVNDLSRLLIIWVLMLGASAAIGLREHLVVDFLVDLMPGRIRAVSAYAVRALQIAMGFILLVSGSVVTTGRMDIEYIQLGLPTGFAFLAIPVLGFFMMVFGILMRVNPSSSPAGADLAEGDER